MQPVVTTELKLIYTCICFSKKKILPIGLGVYWSWHAWDGCLRQYLAWSHELYTDHFQIGVPVQWGKHCNLLAVAGWYFQSHAWMLMNGLQPFQHFDMNWGFITSVWKCLLLPHQSAGVTFISNSCSLPPYMPNNRIVHETSLIWSHFAQESGLG